MTASSRLRLSKKNDVSILFNPPLEGYTIYTEPNRVLQVLANFVNNAIKFTEKGKIEIGYQVRERDVLFFVSDTLLVKGFPKKNIPTFSKGS